MEVINKLHITLFILSLLCISSTPLSAQNTADKLKNTEKGKGSVTVTQSADIDALVNRTKLTATPQDNKTKTNNTQAAQESTITIGAEQQAEGINPDVGEDETQSEVRKPATKLDDDRIHLSEDFNPEAAETVTGPKIMRGTRTVRGYRIQVYAGTSKGADRRNAEQACRTIKNKYPSLPVYVHFISPRWICQCGNYHKYKEAQTFLKKIQSLGFPNASIVRSSIMVNSSDKKYKKSIKNNEED